MMKVVQCWDDGVVNDIRLTGIFRKYGAKATFNLNPGAMPEVRHVPHWAKQPCAGPSHFCFNDGRLALKDIPEVYDGFQVASHCWRHENADSTPGDQWIKAAIDARRYLEDIFQRPCPGFAWPCGATTPAAVDLLRENGFAYGRTTVSTFDATDCAEPLLLAANCHYMARDFWTRYEKARETGVFYFWGHSYEMMDYDGYWNYFEETIRLISEDPGAEWADVIDIVPLLRPGKAQWR